MTRILIPLATCDFDVTEVVVPWNAFRAQGWDVVFATEDARPGACDPRLLSGVIFGMLGATAENVALYRRLEQDEAFQKPIPYAAIRAHDYAALLLPGGHAPGMRQYLESKVLQEKVLAFFAAGTWVAAICHGPVVLARTTDPASGRSVLAGRTMTALPKPMEWAAYLSTAWKLGRYYRTYPEYVEDEVIRAIGDAARFRRGPLFPSAGPGFVVEDGNLITARWPGDARVFAERIIARVSGGTPPRTTPPSAPA